MPATEPQFSTANKNYPPDAGRAEADLILRTPFWLALPFTFNTADAAALYTVPTGLRMRIHEAAWEVTAGFTGGTASAIGLSSNDANNSTKGDLLGAAGGDVAATLVTTGNPLKGTIGTKFTRSATGGLIVLAAGTIIRFDRIASAFTAGTGLAHVFASFVPAS